MTTPQLSDIVTEGIRVGATAFYLPEESDPDQPNFVFGYRILISNEGTEGVRLLSRHWIIIDADGKREEKEGPGVVGQTPDLAPGQAFKYHSFCPLKTPWGTMEGTYTMERPNGSQFKVRIGRFYLAVPRPVPAAR